MIHIYYYMIITSKQIEEGKKSFRRDLCIKIVVWTSKLIAARISQAANISYITRTYTVGNG